VGAKKRLRNEFDFIEWYSYHKDMMINCIGNVNKLAY